MSDHKDSTKKVSAEALSAIRRTAQDLSTFEGDATARASDEELANLGVSSPAGAAPNGATAETPSNQTADPRDSSLRLVRQTEPPAPVSRASSRNERASKEATCPIPAGARTPGMLIAAALTLFLLGFLAGVLVGK